MAEPQPHVLGYTPLTAASQLRLPSRERIWQHVVRLHRAVAVALLDGQGHVLLEWRHRFVQDRWGWELPGGLVDEDEEPDDAAVREMEEQTGYRAGQLEHMITFQPVAEMADGERVVFVGRDAQHVGGRLARRALSGPSGCRWGRCLS